MTPERLKQIRTKNRLTQEEFGAKIGLEQNTVSCMELGIRKITRQTEILIDMIFNKDSEDEDSVPFATNGAENNSMPGSDTEKINIEGHDLYVKEQTFESEEVISASKKVYELMKDIANLDQETFWVISMNTKNKIIGKDLLSMGSASQTRIYPSVLFRRILLHNATQFILCHNHPSGSLEPSFADKDITRKIIEYSKFLEIGFLEHLIIGKDDYSSVNEYL